MVATVVATVVVTVVATVVVTVVATVVATMVAPWLATRDGILDVHPESECFERNYTTKTDS